MSTQVLHMRLGKNFGILLAQIAQEHIQYNYDVKKGLETIIEGLPGVPLDMALKIIKGDYIIEVAENGEEVVINTERNETHSAYPIFNVGQWCGDKYQQIFKEGGVIEDILKTIRSKFIHRSKIWVDIPVSSLRGLFAGTINGDDIVEILLDDEYIGRAYDGAVLAKKYLETSLKIHNTINTLSRLYFDIFTDNEKTHFEIYHNEALNKMGDVTQLIQSMMDGNFKDEQEDDSVTNYINAMSEINEIITKGIEPVNIMDNYSAGWLSPDGDFYGLNGEIANMLHNQIADALQEKGIIPKDEGCPDSWLERQGWVKIHDNNVHFAGCLNDKLGLPIVQMTDKQIQMIFDYIQNCHQSMIKLGWRLTPLSAGMFYGIAQDRMAMNNKYFNF